MIKTKPKKVILLGGVAAKRKQVVKTEPEKAVWPGGVTAKVSKYSRQGGVNYFAKRVGFKA